MRQTKKGKIFKNENNEIKTKSVEFNRPYYKINTTVAGCGKEIAHAMWLYSYKNNITVKESVYKLFNHGTQFDETCSGRTTSGYEDRTKRNYDYEELTYNGIQLRSHGGIIIEDTTYTLDLSEEDYKEILKIERDKDNIKRILNIKGELIERDKLV